MPVAVFLTERKAGQLHQRSPSYLLGLTKSKSELQIWCTSVPATRRLACQLSHLIWYFQLSRMWQAVAGCRIRKTWTSRPHFDYCLRCENLLGVRSLGSIARRAPDEIVLRSLFVDSDSPNKCAACWGSCKASPCTHLGMPTANHLLASLP